MGAYLDLLREIQKCQDTEPKKPNKAQMVSSFGFLGTSPEHFKNSNQYLQGAWCSEARVVIASWLSSLDEDDPLVIEDVMNKSSCDPDGLDYFLWRAGGGD